ncbi:hypothetical protein TH53_06915 [Pedobacter lusitanus]|uniref:Contig28, whole genome shotgun sequence n=1 Tax=Pedobacter lusitanus TaxID=1503925 RepID=A0A0D0GU20_9SPHI|nr:M15 family metallopeptidase [Pedobacter lusitanus]KIO77861.1 hypothetical protein TH53_06915 [Pedobacter lusitanus]
MLTADVAIAKYGLPNETGSGYLVSMILPFPMRLSWLPKKTIKSFQCHESVATQLIQIFTAILHQYGFSEIQRLGIDLYGGCFNYREMREGTSLSIHSWGLAVDLDPEHNTLRETSETAKFAQPEYKPMIDIFYRYGFESLGRERNYDWMHFQVKS